jgi:hypothetical protein
MMMRSAFLALVEIDFLGLNHRFPKWGFRTQKSEMGFEMTTKSEAKKG